MKSFLGGFLIAAGVVLGLYVGLWLCFIGGIVGFIEAVQVSPVIPMDIAFAFAKFWFSALIGWIAAAVCIYPGLKLLK